MINPYQNYRQLDKAPVGLIEHARLSVEWALERESVLINKMASLPKPWTNNAIIRDHRFCNVDRFDDKETIAFFEWYRSNIDLYGEEDLWFNIAIARWINWSPSVIKTGWTSLEGGYDPDDLYQRMKDAQDSMSSEKFFTGAYMIRGATRGEFSKDEAGEKLFQLCRDKIYFLCHRVFQSIYEVGAPKKSETLESYANRLEKAYSNGAFMCGQQIADLKYFTMYQASDWSTWGPVGPGPTRYLNRAFGRDLNKSIPSDNYKSEMDALCVEILKVLDEYKDHPMYGNVQDALADAHNMKSNLLCESDKYIRLMEGGQVRSKYNGKGDSDNKSRPKLPLVDLFSMTS